MRAGANPGAYRCAAHGGSPAADSSACTYNGARAGCNETPRNGGSNRRASGKVQGSPYAG